MKRSIAVLFVSISALLASGFGQQTDHAALRVMLNEVQPAAMASPQYCTLIFSDRRFHSEKADNKAGNDVNRKIYEGQLSDSEWNSLIATIDSPQFRDLKVPRTVPPLVMQDTHPYTISIAREDSYQNMEFLNGKSLKPYEAQVKPLLEWWKTLRGQHTPASSSGPDKRCELDNTRAIFAQ